MYIDKGVDIVKKFLSVIIITFILFSLSACSNVKPGEFTATVEYINEKLNNADLPVYVEELEKSTGGGTIETKVLYIISLKDKNEPEKSIGLLSLNYKDSFCDRFAVSNGLQYKGWENAKKFIRFACDLYGVNSKTITDKVKDNFESGKDIEYNGLSSMKIGFFESGFHYEFSFLPEIEGDYSLDNMNLLSIIITEENKFKADKREAEQLRQKNIADNPLLFSDGEPDYPQWKTADEINSLLIAEKLPFNSEFDYFTKTDIGTANTAYILYSDTGEKAGYISTVCFTSGYEYSIFQNILDESGFITRISTEHLLKAVCGITDTEYSDELLKTINDYQSTNEITVYFEYDGYYWRLDFGNLYANYRYLHGITVYETDVLEGRLLSWINSYKENKMDYREYQEIYDRFFG